MKEENEKIYSRKDGKFEIRYHYGYKENGTANYKSAYGNSEQEVLDNYHQILSDLIKKNEKTVFKNRKYGTLPTPLKEGYVFKGWYTEPNGQGKEITEETEVEINEEQTLYAKWETINENNLNNSIANLNITAKPGNPNFANLATTDEGIYKREDDYGTSYYYRGAVNNNYVKFAGFYWRIIRVNGASSRLLYFRVWNNPTSKSNPNPSFKCLQKNDSFTVNDTEKGNRALDEKVGLITADELVTAGAKWVETNTDYYLYKGVSFWTMSPFILWWDSYPHPDLFVSNTDCVLNNNNVEESYGVSPVINLTPESVQTMIGDGTANNPYQIKEIE